MQSGGRSVKPAPIRSADPERPGALEAARPHPHALRAVGGVAAMRWSWQSRRVPLVSAGSLPFYPSVSKLVACGRGTRGNECRCGRRALP